MSVNVLMLVILIPAIVMLLGGMLHMGLQNRATVRYVREQYGIHISFRIAEALNDHRSSRENCVRVKGRGVLVKTRGRRVELQAVSEA